MAGTAPPNYQTLTDHEAAWLRLYYEHCMVFWSRYKIEPDASKSPAFGQKLDFVVHQKCGDKSDLETLHFAKFVCREKALPYTGLSCTTIMDPSFGEFPKLNPPN